MYQLFLGVAAMLVLIPQPQQSSSGRAVALGKPIVLADSVTLTVATGSSRSLEAFGPVGKTVLVIDLQFETKTYTTIGLEPSSDATKSEVVLDVEGQKVAPAALTNYFVDRSNRPNVIRVAALTPMPTTGKGYFSCGQIRALESSERSDR